MLPQAPPFPPADHIEIYKVTRAVVRQDGNKVVMKGRLVKVKGGPQGGSGRLKINVNLRGPKPKLVNSKTAGNGVAFGNGKLTGKQ